MRWQKWKLYKLDSFAAEFFSTFFDILNTRRHSVYCPFTISCYIRCLFFESMDSKCFFLWFEFTQCGLLPVCPEATFLGPVGYFDYFVSYFKLESSRSLSTQGSLSNDENICLQSVAKNTHVCSPMHLSPLIWCFTGGGRTQQWSHRNGRKYSRNCALRKSRIYNLWDSGDIFFCFIFFKYHCSLDKGCKGWYRQHSFAIKVRARRFVDI